MSRAILRCRRLLALLLASVLLSSCEVSVDRDVYFGSSDSEYMAHLVEEMQKAGIPFTVNNDGFIKADEKYRAQFEEVENRVREFRSRFSTIEVEDKAELDFLIGLLVRDGYAFRIIETRSKTYVEAPLVDEEEGLLLEFVEFSFKKNSEPGGCSGVVAHNKSFNAEPCDAGSG